MSVERRVLSREKKSSLVFLSFRPRREGALVVVHHLFITTTEAVLYIFRCVLASL